MSTILFENEDVCILDPTAKGGVLVFTISPSKNICTEGLYSYNELRKVHPEYGLTNRHIAHVDPEHDNLIFFRVPYNSDTSSFESSFDGKPPSKMLSTLKESAIAVIRVDPEKTFVYASEARAHGSYEDLKRSRMNLAKYLKNLEYMKTTYNIRNITNNKKFSNYLLSFGSAIFRMFEVVVKRPHIPSEWFVSCDHNNMSTSRLSFATSTSVPVSSAAGGGGASSVPETTTISIYKPAANTLVVGDRVYTDDGTGTLMDFTKTKYGTNIYTVKLDNGSEKKYYGTLSVRKGVSLRRMYTRRRNNRRNTRTQNRSTRKWSY